MIPLYFYLLLGSVLIPFLFSVFCIDFIKKWKAFIVSTTVIAVLFLIWDAFFTKLKVWGFNESYCLGFKLLEMPIEEWLFFFVIPFCSLFTHFAFFYAFPNIRLTKKTTISLSLLIIIISVLLISMNLSRFYTLVNFSTLVLILVLGSIYSFELLQRFYISFLLILVPFFIVNGILTGAITETPVVWYDNSENLGIRLYTIPLEDLGYCFSMLFGNLMIFEFLQKK